MAILCAFNAIKRNVKSFGPTKIGHGDISRQKIDTDEADNIRYI